MSRRFVVYAALDGHVLNGMEGPAGVLQTVFESAPDSRLTVIEQTFKFYAGAAGGHAVQISPDGEVGFLGGFRGTGVFFHPPTLRRLGDFFPDNIDGRVEVDFRGQTHVAFPPAGRKAWDPKFAERSVITSVGGRIGELDITDFKSLSVKPGFRALADHGLGLTHAMKRSASGRYIFCGAMDTVPGQRVRKVGIFDTVTNNFKPVPINRTAWHVQGHPTQDIMYAVTENYEEDPRGGIRGWYNMSIPVESNYLWKIAADGTVLKVFCLDESKPAHLSSDIVVTGDTDDTVLYNSCASSTVSIVRLNFDDHDEQAYRFIEEGVWLTHGPHRVIPTRLKALRVARRHVKEARQRQDSIFGRQARCARYITRKTVTDGSYGLMLSPDGHRLISWHRGLNEALVYRYPDCIEQGHRALEMRVQLPTYDGGKRVGVHHCYLFQE